VVGLVLSSRAGRHLARHCPPDRHRRLAAQRRPSRQLCAVRARSDSCVAGVPACPTHTLSRAKPASGARCVPTPCTRRCRPHPGLAAAAEGEPVLRPGSLVFYGPSAGRRRRQVGLFPPGGSCKKGPAAGVQASTSIILYLPGRIPR
jgi:hypothetical protein